MGGLEAARSASQLPLDTLKTSQLAAAAPNTSRLFPASTVTPSSGTDETAAKRWNTKNLGLRLGTDLASAATAAVMVAPVISIIDR